MKREKTGRYVTVSTEGERVQAYVPNPLPPEPLPELTGVGMMKYAEAERALGALDAMEEVACTSLSSI